VFTYPHATVRLHFFRVDAWSGVLTAREHEGLDWYDPHVAGGVPAVAPVLPANGPILKALALPNEYALSNATALGAARWLERLRVRLAGGLRLVQLREPAMPSADFESLAQEAVALAHASSARVLVHSDAALAGRLRADGVHLTARQLRSATERPSLPLVAASCHDAPELRAAERLGVDFAVLGPVQETPTHPGASLLGWHGFEREASGASIPVYALGGLGPADVETAWRHGAHGIAMLRGSWE
jgi:8-oxo-dGTP diphosphatase